MIRVIPGFKGIYYIELGSEIKCFSCYNKNWGFGQPHQLSNRPSKKSNRIFWNLHLDGKCYCRQAAYWVAITFPELVQNEHFKGAVIDHIDTNVLNNQPTNLRWTTPKGNTNNPHTLERLRGINAKKRKPIVQYDSMGNVIREYSSLAEAARLTGLHQANISFSALSDHNKCGGYKWKYKEKE